MVAGTSNWFDLSIDEVLGSTGRLPGMMTTLTHPQALPCPPDIDGLWCTWTNAEIRGRSREAWVSEVLDGTRCGRFDVLVLRLDHITGDAEKCDFYGVLRAGMQELEAALLECEKRSGFRPTVFCIQDESPFTRRSDGRKGAGAYGGIYFEDRSDVVVHVTREVAELECRNADAYSDLNWRPFDEIWYRYKLHCRAAGGMTKNVTSDYCAFRRSGAAAIDRLNPGDWEASRPEGAFDRIAATLRDSNRHGK